MTTNPSFSDCSSRTVARVWFDPLADRAGIDRQQQPEVRLGDVAIAVALVLRGRHPGEFDYATLTETPGTRDHEGQALLQNYFALGIRDDPGRLALRRKVEAALESKD